MGIRLKKYLKQDCLYWAKTGVTTAGKVTYAPVVALKCRWEDGMQDHLMDDGRIITSKAHILLSTNVTQGSLIYLGTMATWKLLPNYPAVPTPQQGGFEIIMVGKTPDMKGRDLLVEAWL